MPNSDSHDAMGGAHAVADAGEPGGVVEVDLEPREPEVVEGAGDLEVALGLEVEVEIEVDPDVRPGALAQRPELAPQGVDDPRVGVQLRPPRARDESRHVQARAVLPKRKMLVLRARKPQSRISPASRARSSSVSMGGRSMYRAGAPNR